MKNIDYDSILSGFQRKRLENEILADNRKAEIYEKIPEIKKIDQEIASSSIHTASGLYLPVYEVEASHTDMQIPEEVSAWSQKGSYRVEPEQ